MAVDLTMGVDASGGRDGCAVGPIWMAGKTKEWHGEGCVLLVPVCVRGLIGCLWLTVMCECRISRRTYMDHALWISLGSSVSRWVVAARSATLASCEICRNCLY